MIGACFNNHLYKWNSKILLQKKGGAIGLRATGALAKVTMDHWIKQYREILERHGIKVWLLKKYVDDVMVITNNIPIGSRWNGKEITCTEVDALEDLGTNKTQEAVTTDVLKQLGN